MNFEQARNCLLKGAKIRRHEWPLREYIYLDKNLCICDENDKKLRPNDVFYDYRDENWELYEQPIKPVKTQMLEWFKSEDKMPEADVDLHFIRAKTMHYGRLIRKHNEEMEYFKDYMYGKLYFLIQVDAWAYAPKGE